MSRLKILLCLLPLTYAAASSAQGKPRTALYVLIIDSTNAPVAGADVAVIRGLNEPVARGVSDSAGRGFFFLARDTAHYQIAVRRLGYSRTEVFFSPGDRDTTRLTIVMGRLAQLLAPAVTTGTGDFRSRHLTIDAEGIANSERRLDDAMDIVNKLRPEMVGGRPFCAISKVAPLMKEIWINGRRIYPEFVPLDPQALARSRTTPSRRIAPHVISVLSSLRPEHIAEMVYHDCTDFSVASVGGIGAMFVTLKPGIGFEPGIGSFVAADPCPLQVHQQDSTSSPVVRPRVRC